MYCPPCTAPRPPVLYRLPQEIDVLLGLDHPNVVGLHEYFVSRNRVYLIMELLRGGELLEAVLEMVGWRGRGEGTGGWDGGDGVSTRCQPGGTRPGRCQQRPTVRVLCAACAVQGHYSEADARTIFRQLIEALQYLHSQ